MKTFTHKQPDYPVRHPESIALIEDLLRTKEWTRLEGAPELEADLATFHGNDPTGRKPIPWFIASGTAALEAIMLGHGLGPGDEVVTTPYTWGATVSAILAIGAIPKFADIDADSGLLTPETVAASHRRPRPSWWCISLARPLTWLVCVRSAMTTRYRSLKTPVRPRCAKSWSSRR